MASRHPYYRKELPEAKIAGDYAGAGVLIDFRRAQFDGGAGALGPQRVAKARALFDERTAAAVRAAAAVDGGFSQGPPRIWPPLAFDYVLTPVEDEPVHFGRVPTPGPWFEFKDLLEVKWYGDKAPRIYIPRSKCLALLAYLDCFPDERRIGLGLRAMVSRAVLGATSGWCGTFGPGVDGAFSLEGEEGNYDMSAQHLLIMAYRYYDDLSAAAREHLIGQLLKMGRVHRPRKEDTFTSGANPNDWERAGFVSPLAYHVSIGETENHVLMIVTVRYLTNQLLYPRDGAIEHDNRRNGSDDTLSCFALLLMLLRNMLGGDFSEYNAKSYQSETRWALLNLCTYAYDHEVRLAARMVLDYRAAHIAVSSNDLRRMVPFRRRFDDVNAAHDARGFMRVGLLATDGGDPMAAYFAISAGNLGMDTRGHPPSLGLRHPDLAADMLIEALSDYRMPPAIHDLFVNDSHRRFFQRLRRMRRDDRGGNRNCDNTEIYAGSPSYLISAGGAPALWAIDPGILAVIDGEKVSQQLGVAVTTSFMPTGFAISGAADLIQFGSFSMKHKFVTQWSFLWFDVAETNTVLLEQVQNYGVAPDFACGHQISLPDWVSRFPSEGVEDGIRMDPRVTPGFSFVDAKASAPGPGFYLAIYQQAPGGPAAMEAFDTWRDPTLSFRDFKHGVLSRNASLRVLSNEAVTWTTTSGNRITFVTWIAQNDIGKHSGALVREVTYADPNHVDALDRADHITERLVNGTILRSDAYARVTIANPALKSTLTLDFTDPAHPRRMDSQTGETEVAGFGHEVWLDFANRGPAEGDACRPYGTLAAAIDAVAEAGTIRIVPGRTRAREPIGGSKSFRLVAPIGGVTLGAADDTPVIEAELLEGLSNRDVWVQFDWPPINRGDAPWLFDRLADALAVVADGGTVNIEPGTTPERLEIGAGGKRLTLVAPIGGVRIGAA
jgi:hypothetical protein